MTSRQHMRVGGSAAMAITWWMGDGLPAVALAIALTGAALGAVLPDLDAPGAKPSRVLIGRPMYLALRFVISNPIVWLLVGWRHAHAAQPTTHRKGEWLSRLCHNRATAALFGNARCARSAARLSYGRRRWRQLLDHRNLSHSALALSIASAAWGALAWALLGTPNGQAWIGQDPAIRGHAAVLAAFGMGAGVSSHILLDMCTVSGVPVLLPWSARRLWLLPSFLRVRTG